MIVLVPALHGASIGSSYSAIRGQVYINVSTNFLDMIRTVWMRPSLLGDYTGELSTLVLLDAENP